MPLVAAKCTQCGANIEVDDIKEAGICKIYPEHFHYYCLQQKKSMM